MIGIWSKDSVAATHRAIADCVVAPDGVLHMKNRDGSYGAIHLENLVLNRLVIEDENGAKTRVFDSIHNLIAAGWVVD